MVKSALAGWKGGRIDRRKLVPAYIKARRRRTAQYVKDFILNVLLDDADSDEYRNVVICIDMFQEDGYINPAEAFCDYFDLGDCFYGILCDCEFPFDEFSIELEATADELDRDAQEMYDDIRHDYITSVMPRGGLMG